MNSCIKEAYFDICARMERACAAAGRDVSEVRLVAVSKYVPVSRMQEAYDLGVRVFGENHAQELHEKQTFFEQDGCSVHFIGHLQTNKLKYVCGSSAMIESVDRIGLVEALQTRGAAHGIVSDVLVQVNIGDEPQKGGVAVAELSALLDAVVGSGNLRLRGAMCVPPALAQEEVRPYFARMRALFERMQSAYPQQRIDTLSMGMSHDFEVAIQEGATEVRVGSALFGAREQK